MAEFTNIFITVFTRTYYITVLFTFAPGLPARTLKISELLIVVVQAFNNRVAKILVGIKDPSVFLRRVFGKTCDIVYCKISSLP